MKFLQYHPTASGSDGATNSRSFALFKAAFILPNTPGVRRRYRAATFPDRFTLARRASTICVKLDWCQDWVALSKQRANRPQEMTAIILLLPDVDALCLMGGLASMRLHVLGGRGITSASLARSSSFSVPSCSCTLRFVQDVTGRSLTRSWACCMLCVCV